MRGIVRPPVSATPYWHGVFPAITTQMFQSGQIDIEGTLRHSQRLIDSGIQGLIYLGSLGENQVMTGDEKRLVAKEMVQAFRGKVPILFGVAESSTQAAIDFSKDCQTMGADGLMLMPAMSYRTPDPEESLAHLTHVARAIDLPIMIYNNPIAYANDITPEMFLRLAEIANFVALKESSANTRRITDLHNTVPGRYAIFTGVDDLVLESGVLGIDGWVAGTGIAFPEENQALWEAIQEGRWNDAVAIYRWFTPMLHLDTHIKFVQYIKLCAQEAGIGTEWTRAPRLPIAGEERVRVLKIIHDGIAARPCR